MKKFLKLFLLLFLLYLPGMVVGESGEPDWYWVRPKPTGNDLTSIKFINAMTGYACGNNGDIIKTINGGANWTSVETPTRNRLNGIYATQSGRIIVVGDSSTILQSSDSGNTWNQIPNISPNVTMTSVKIVNDSVAYAGGFSGTFIYQSHIFKTTDGGVVWNRLSGTPNNTIYSVNFFSENYGMISGGNSTYITYNGGQSWIPQSISYVLITIGKCITFLDSLNIGITFSGMKYFVETTNGGQSWTSHDVTGFIPIGDNPEAHTLINDSTWLIVTRFGRILKTTNRGMSWQLNQIPINLWWVEKLQDNSIIACGYGGTIIKSSDSGNTWNTLMGSFHSLNHLVFVNQSTGFACGNRGTIIKTTDQGETWNDLTSSVTVKLNQLYFINESTGYCVGDTGKFLKTTNAGDTWISLNSSTTSELWSVYFHNEMKGTIGAMGRIITTTNGGSSWHTEMFSTFDRFYSMIFLNELEGLTAFDGDIYRTTNGGFNWSLVFSQNSYGANLFFIDTEKGIYLGGNRITKTSNSGSTWNSNTIVFNHIPNNIYFGSEFIGLASHGISSFINGMSKTTNGGNTWNSYPTVSANINNWISFINANTGIAVDSRGGIIKTTTEIITDVEQILNFVPESIELFQNYPNPFNPSTKIRFSLPERAHIKISITDVTGRVISILADGQFVEGIHEVTFNAVNLPAGVYFYTLYQNNNFVQTKKLILLK